MCNYIIHNLGLTFEDDVFESEYGEPGKPVREYSNYYIGKAIGEKGSELDLYRPRRNGEYEKVPNCVLRNENGIALLRVHNQENLKIFDIRDNSENVVKDCVETPISSYPYAYVVIDYRDDKWQVAIEKTSAWDSKTNTIRNSIEDYFNKALQADIKNIKIDLDEKHRKVDIERFVDKQIYDNGDFIESLTFQCINTKKKPTARVPEQLQDEMDLHSKIMELYGAVSETSTFKMGSNPSEEVRKRFTLVAMMCVDNALKMNLHFNKYGDFSCTEEMVAQYPMNDIAISNYKDYIIPDYLNRYFDLESWLDYVFDNVKKGKDEDDDEDEIPTKPM